MLYKAATQMQVLKQCAATCHFLDYCIGDPAAVLQMQVLKLWAATCHLLNRCIGEVVAVLQMQVLTLWAVLRHILDCCIGDLVAARRVHVAQFREAVCDRTQQCVTITVISQLGLEVLESTEPF